MSDLDPLDALARLRERAKQAHMHLPSATPPFNVVCSICDQIDRDYAVILAASSQGWKTAHAVAAPVRISLVPPSGSEEVTHIYAGRVLCGAVSGQPSSWPRGHFRVGPEDADKATCTRCLDLFLARNYGT